MGLSNMLQGGGAAGAEAGATPATPTGDVPAGGATPAAPAQKSFGDRLGDYFKNRYPIAGGLAGMVFDPQQNQAAVAPLAPVPGNTQPDYSQMIAQNAQPQQGGGGLGAILKLIGL